LRGGRIQKYLRQKERKKGERETSFLLPSLEEPALLIGEEGEKGRGWVLQQLTHVMKGRERGAFVPLVVSDKGYFLSGGTQRDQCLGGGTSDCLCSLKVGGTYRGPFRRIENLFFLRG